MRLQPTGRPSLAGELTEADHDLMDDARFSEFQDWDRRRTNPGGAYHMGEYNIREVFGWMRWLKGQRITLRQRLRESVNAHRIHELERENDRLSVQLANQSRTLEPADRLRAECAELRRELAMCTREMRKYQMAVPGRNGRG
jgi:hypothetical protein